MPLPKLIRIFSDLTYGSGINSALRGFIHALESLGYNPSTVRVISAEPYYVSELDAIDGLNHYVFQDWPHEREDLTIVLVNDFSIERYSSLAFGSVAYCSSWSSKLVPDAVAALNKFREVWVPSKHLQRVFTQSGVVVPIYVVRFSLTRDIPEGNWASAINKTRFYAVGRWDSRHNVEAVIQNYLQTGFTKVDPVHLTCQCTPRSRNDFAMEREAWVAKQGAIEVYNSMPNTQDLPSLAVLTKLQSYSDYYALHKSHDVFVSASAGEGFPMSVVEALACGNAVIAAGPWLEELVELESDSEPMMIYRTSALFKDGLYTPYNNDIQEAMRALQKLPYAKLFVSKVREHYSPAAVGSAIRKRLTEVTE